MIKKNNFEISNPKKILFPKSKISKDIYINYYEKIAKKILPLLRDRPISLNRFPEGIDKKKFFQKASKDYYPKWIKTVFVKREGNTPIKMALINDLDSLLYIANQVGEIHINLSRKDKLNYPDKIAFDLDVSKADFPLAKKAARDLKKVLDKFKLTSYLMTTGSKGLHVVIPIKREKSFKEIRVFAKKIASLLVKENPKQYTIDPRKNKRKNKVFIDYLRNSFAQTHIAPYSIRAIESAPIATPISWKELPLINDAKKYNIKNIFKRRSDPFFDIDRNAISIKNALKKIDAFI